MLKIINCKRYNLNVKERKNNIGLYNELKNTRKIYDDVFKVKKNNKYNIVNKKFKLISNIWFDYIYDFNYIEYAVVKLNNKYNIINYNGKLFSDVWFDGVRYFGEKLIIVKMNGKYNIMDINSSLLFNIWFDDIIPFLHGDVTNNQFKVYLNNEIYKIDNNGNIKHFCGGY